MFSLKKTLLTFGTLLAFAIAPVYAAKKPAPSAKTKSAKKTTAKKNTKPTAQKKASSKTTAKAKSKKGSPTLALSRSKNGRMLARGSSPYKQASFKRPNRQPTVIMSHSLGTQAGLNRTIDPLALTSSAAVVLDPIDLKVLFEKNSHVPLPMASITKMMTALVVVESMQNMNEMLEITPQDVEQTRGTRSRLRVGTRMSRADMLHLALMSSENRAAAALGRNFPGGISAFVNEMNIKARVLGMTDARFVDTSGLSPQNVASALDLSKLVMAASQYPILRKYSTDSGYTISDGSRPIQFGNTNRLIHTPGWDIDLQKTGYISAAGQCLIMQSVIGGRPVIMVLLDSKGKVSRAEDAGRVRRWLQNKHDPIGKQPQYTAEPGLPRV